MGRFIRVGQIVGAFGIRGQVKVKVLTDFIERFDVGRRLRLNGEWTTVEACSEHKGMLILTLDRIPDRTEAERQQWSYLEAAEEARPELDDGEYLTAELVGLTVQDESGEVLGTVDRVDRYPAHDVLIIGEAMVPAVAEFVLDVDLDKRVMTIRPIAGMFEV